MTKKAHFHQHQLEAFDSIISAIKNGKGSAKGRVVIPTSGGKTWVEASVLNHQINATSASNIHIVLAPTIMLTNKLIYEYRKFGGTKYNEIAFHSGDDPEFDNTLINPLAIKATTKPDQVYLEVIAAQSSGKDLVIFSTYHSCHRLKQLQVMTLIADESHHCVAKVFNKAVNAINANVKLFFTATEKHTTGKNGRGLNNTSMYGELLYSIPPRELIARGLIVPPILHVLNCRTQNIDESESEYLLNMVTEMAVHQHHLASEYLGHSKILFAMANTHDVEYIRKKYSGNKK
jgi:superfamily II DNA or RNA helicase